MKLKTYKYKGKKYLAANKEELARKLFPGTTFHFRVKQHSQLVKLD